MLFYAAVVYGAGASAAKLNCSLSPPTPTTLLRRPRETWEHEGLGIWAHWERYAARACVDLENVYYVQVGANCGANVRRCALGVAAPGFKRWPTIGHRAMDATKRRLGKLLLTASYDH